MIANRIVGATNGKRHKNDFYSTPAECTETLLNELHIPKSWIIWECANGSGAISDRLEYHGYTVIKTDIVTGDDFLTTTRNADMIITNPPFNIADKFIERAWSLAIPFALLLKTQYFNSKKRLELFNKFTPTWIYPLTWRPDFTGQGSSLMDMNWVVWGGC
jgi:hypothetical protein